VSTIFADHVLNFFKNNLKDDGFNYLEIGVYFGVGISTLADEFPKKQIFAIDPFIEDGNTSHHSGVGENQPLRSQRGNTFELASTRPNIKIFEMTSQQFYTELTEDAITSMNVNAVFIDGDHHYEHVVNDYKLALSLIGNKPGIVVFDDTSLDGVVRAMAEFENSIQSRLAEKIDLGRTSMAYKLS